MRSLKIKIDGLFLSRNGTDFNEPCDLQLPQFEELFAENVGTVQFTASGRAVTTVVPSKSIPFEIKLYKLYESVYQQLIDAAQANIEAQMTNEPEDVSFEVEISGHSIDESLTFEAVWSPQQPYKRERFIDAASFGVSLRLIKI